MCHESSAAYNSDEDNVGGCGDQYWSNLTNLVNCMEGVFEDESFFLKSKETMKTLAVQKANQKQVCSLLLELGERLRIEKTAISKPDDLDMWLDTMRFFAVGQLSQHCDRFADTSVNELLGCLDKNCGSLSEAWAETE